MVQRNGKKHFYICLRRFLTCSKEIRCEMFDSWQNNYNFLKFPEDFSTFLSCRFTFSFCVFCGWQTAPPSLFKPNCHFSRHSESLLPLKTNVCHKRTTVTGSSSSITTGSCILPKMSHKCIKLSRLSAELELDWTNTPNAQMFYKESKASCEEKQMKNTECDPRGAP